MRDLVKSFAAVAWRSVFPRRAKPSQWSVSTAAEQQHTAVSSPQQHISVAAETNREIVWQTGSVDPLLGVPGLAEGGDAHPLPPATDGGAGTGHNTFVESARQACQNDTITNGASVSPAKTEVPDLAVPHIEDGIGESFAAGVGLAMPHIEDGIGEQSSAAGVEQQHNSVLLEDASSVKITKDELESFATEVKDALGAQKPQGVQNPHDNELFRLGCSQRSLQKEQERLAEIKLQIIAIGAEIQICQAVIEAPKSPEELLKAQEELKGLAAELKKLANQLSKGEASKDLEGKSAESTGAPVNDEALPASDRIMAVHTKPAEALTKKSPPKSLTAKPKEQPKEPPLSKRQLPARAAQAKPKQVIAEHDNVFQPKSQPEAEVPQEMTAEEQEGLAELIQFNMHHYPYLFKSQEKTAKAARKQAPPKSTPVLSAEQAALQSITALKKTDSGDAMQAEMKTRPAQVFIHSLNSNRGPHGELMFLLPRMDEMHRLHEVMKIDFHTPAIIRSAGRTLAARDVVDILRVYITVLHRIVGHFLPAEGVTLVTGRGVRTGARTFRAVGAELARLKAEGIFISDFYAHLDKGAYTISIRSSPNLRKKSKW
ncbi:hypothetical protein WJX82_007879 [Trebouxia sp. C0006]